MVEAWLRHGLSMTGQGFGLAGYSYGLARHGKGHNGIFSHYIVDVNYY